MFHLNEAFYHEEMPARAKRLFVKTFKKYHKLDGGDEDVALHMAKQAVDREYVKLNNRWIPKTAAEEIVRHDLDDDSLSESESSEHYRQPSVKTPVALGRGSSSIGGKYTRGVGGGTVKGAHYEENDDFLSESDHQQSDDNDDDDYTDDDEDEYDDGYRLVRHRKLARGGRGGRVNGGGIEKQSARRSVINGRSNKLAFK
ncbi:hypothetical protein [Spodoptera cosmioides nucleopolyhedrovirus]|uniref:ChaB-like protein n=1 Tax=Spodoptera cosmioides nucleopolyhedrovirus TaxID=2605774 RepID=A0A6B7KH69_9ABAC|nr:hypothetical protein [Spodoptera cosmioides nucleopolyhedrovirus]